MLAGIGFSRLRNTWLRWIIVAITLGIALLSLIPYYTIWNKDYSRDAFLTLPQSEQGGVILLEKSYISSLPYFYLGTDASVIGLNYNDADSEHPFLDTRFGTGFIYGYESLTCEDIISQQMGNVWIYGNKKKLSERLSAIPGCFGDAELWIFNNGNWEPFDL